MTLIVLAVLATAWLGYFVLWFRERRASQPVRSNGAVSFNRPFKSMDRSHGFAGGQLARLAAARRRPFRTRQGAHALSPPPVVEGALRGLYRELK